MTGWDRARHVATEVLLTLGAVVGVVCLVAAVAAAAFDIRPLVFRSGSMAPEIPTGSLALARTVPAAEVRVGDVVSAPDAVGTRVTHRVVRVEPRGGGVVALTLRGDANAEDDATPYVVREVDRVFWHADGLGYVVQRAQSPPVVFVVGAAAGALLVLSVRSRRADRTNDEERSTAGVAAGAAVLVGLALLAPRPTSTLAVLTDAAAARSGTVAALSPAGPTGLSCTTVGGLFGVALTSARISWTAPAGPPTPDGYLVTLTAAGGATQSFTTTATSFTVSGGLLGTGLLAADQFTVAVRAVYFTNWSTAAATTVTARTASLLGLGIGVGCA